MFSKQKHCFRLISAEYFRWFANLIDLKDTEFPMFCGFFATDRYNRIGLNFAQVRHTQNV